LNRVLIYVVTFVIAFGAGQAVAQEAPKRATRTIILVRHGNYVSDPNDTNPGPGLSPLGIAQANLVAARLAAMPVKFDAVVSSPMTRALDTAKVIAQSLPGAPFQVVKDLAECTPRTRRKENMVGEKPEKVAACETKLDGIFRTRFIAAYGNDRTEVLVCHGNVIRYLVTRALGVPTDAWLEMSVAHASITQIRVEEDGRFKVSSVGDIGHVPPNLQTGASGMSEKSLVVPAR
jgi:serine/threonine-protein phosphatase PGAM5